MWFKCQSLAQSQSSVSRSLEDLSMTILLQLFTSFFLTIQQQIPNITSQQFFFFFCIKRLKLDVSPSSFRKFYYTNETKCSFSSFNFLKYVIIILRSVFSNWPLRGLLHKILYASFASSVLDNVCTILNGAGLWAGWSVVGFPTEAGNFSLYSRVQAGLGAYQAFNPIGTRGSFPGGEAAWAWSWPLTSI
jgi:hypothetical protein